VINLLSRALDASARACDVVIGLGLLAAVSVNLMQVAWRYLLEDPLPWSEEAMRYVMIWIAMLGSAAALPRGEHMAMSLIGAGWPRGLAKAGSIITLLGVAAFCGIALWFGGPTFRRAMQQTSPAAEIPMWIPYLGVYVGCALMLVQSVLMLLLGRRLEGPGEVVA
jgi:TRAP-type C4-dicarboxylate transport system permease small subunit